VILDAPPVVGSWLLALELSGGTAEAAARDRIVDVVRQVVVGPAM
jgi:hypothetical protein